MAIKLFGIYIVLNLFDWITTKAAIAAGGIEVNPLANYLIENYTIYSILLFKLIGITFFWFMLKLNSEKDACIILVICNIIYSLVVINNYAIANGTFS